MRRRVYVYSTHREEQVGGQVHQANPVSATMRFLCVRTKMEI